MSGKSVMNSNVGTVLYSSPEVVSDKQYDCRTDVWSLGCILYQLCSGQVPFSGPYEKALIHRICNMPAPHLPHGYTEDLNSIFQHCMTKNPELRPSASLLLLDPSKPQTSPASYLKMVHRVANLAAVAHIKHQKECFDIPAYQAVLSANQSLQ